MTYRVSWYVPYEGENHEYFMSLEDVINWIKINSGRYERSYDNLTILEIAREIDVYRLMKEEV